MAIVGGNIETEEIGLKIELSGTHKNTEIDATGKLILKAIDTDGSGKPVYSDEGTWISDVIDLQDNFADFDKVFTTNTDNGSSSIAILTRVSDDSVNWSDWVAVAYDGAIQSETKQFIQIRVDFFAGFETDTYEVDKQEYVDSNKFTTLDENKSLRLKREYEFDMTLDNTWTGEGSLHRKKITRDEWLRIDKMNVLQKG